MEKGDTVDLNLFTMNVIAKKLPGAENTSAIFTVQYCYQEV